MKAIRSIARLVGTIMLILVAFFLVGVFAPKVELETTVNIEVEPVKVFDALTDPIQIEHWMFDFGSLQIDSVDELAAGRSFQLTLTEANSSTEIKGVVTAFNSPERLDFAFSRAEADGQMSIEIERVNDHSLVTLIMKPKGTDWFSRSSLPIIQSSLETDLINRSTSLKNYLEN